jgi:hypothetical protein
MQFDSTVAKVRPGMSDLIGEPSWLMLTEIMSIFSLGTGKVSSKLR